MPGFKGGGPIKSITNLVDSLGDCFEFLIVTSDRDLGDAVSYNDVQLNKWVVVGKAKVFYASPDKLSFFNLAMIVKNTHCDVLYMNSFFSINFSIKPLLAWKSGFFKGVPVVLAPRGEFSTGALEIKSFKKRAFIVLVKLLGIYKSIIFQATTKLEKNDIVQTFRVKESMIFLAKNLPGKVGSFSSEKRLLITSKQLRLVFLSRISPKKNLIYALTILQGINMPVCFDIYGPIEDAFYWLQCGELIEKLPDNISVRYCGVVNPVDVRKVFSQYDIFFFPTRGENYGHVIAEALSVGTSVLLSDKTPWRNLQDDGLGWDFPLDEENLFICALAGFCRLSISKRCDLREIVFENACKRIFNPKDIEANRNLFFKALSS